MTKPLHLLKILGLILVCQAQLTHAQQTQTQTQTQNQTEQAHLTQAQLNDSEKTSPFLLAATSKNKEQEKVKAKSTLEIGMGAFAMNLPQYLGSDQSDSYVVPLPYIYYQDDKYKIDRNQFTGKLWQDNHYYLDLSASGGVKVNSEDNDARENMADLDWVFELGPSIKYYFAGDPLSRNYLFAEFFTRKAVATDFTSVTNAGWRFGPSFTYQKAFSISSFQQGHGRFELTTRATINFSDDTYHNYYYGVSPADEQVSRAAYDSAGGYAGSDISVGLTYKIDRWWFSSFTRFYYLDGAEYDNSPLVKERSNWSFGFGAAWIFYQR